MIMKAFNKQLGRSKSFLGKAGSLSKEKEKDESSTDLTQLQLFREIAANLLLKAGNSKEKVFLVTSASQGVGKTTFSFNLVSLLSMEGKRALLVSDYSGSFMTTIVAKGLSFEDLLTGKSRIEEESSPLLVTVRDPSSLELYDRKIFKEWLERIKRSFDLIVIDLPALPHPLPLLSIPLVDWVILIADSEKTHQTSLINAKRNIEKAGGNILGVVLNKYSSPIPPVLSRWLQLEE